MARIVQMTLDEDLVKAVDAEAKRLGTTRSGFTREALREALLRIRIRAEEERHRRGYERNPPRPGELAVAESDLSWGDTPSSGGDE